MSLDKLDLFHSHSTGKNYSGLLGNKTCSLLNQKNCRQNGTVKRQEAETNSLSAKQVDHLLQLLKSTPTGSVAQTGDIPSSYSSGLTLAPWIIDSGASDHMTGTSQFFQSYYPCPGNKKVRIADGSFSSIAGTGSVQISEKIELNSVLHVPKLACNLLSVSKFSRDSNCRVIFFDSHCKFQDQLSGKMIGSAKMIDGLYYFDETLFNNKQVQGLSSSESYAHEQTLIVQKIASEHNGSDFVFAEDPEAKKELWKIRKEALWACFAWNQILKQ